MTFLHGTLKVHVNCAEDLPDTDTAFFNIDGKDVTDPYVSGYLGKARLFKTRYITNDLNPVWDEHFNVDVCHCASSLTVNLKDKEHIGAAFIASTVIRTEDLLGGDPVEGWFDLQNGDKACGRLNMSVQYVPIAALQDEFNKELPKAYFPMRENNRLVLYQDADTPALPQVCTIISYFST